jgi:hypothetical protein
MEQEKELKEKKIDAVVITETKKEAQRNFKNI